MEKVQKKAAACVRGAGQFFGDFKRAVQHGDFFVKLSLLWMGAGYFGRKQYIKSVLMTVFEALVILYTAAIGMQYVPKFGTLGTVKREAVFNIMTMKNEFNDYDNSFMILLFSVVTFVIWGTFLVIYICNVKRAWELQKMAERGEHINTFLEDVDTYRNENFYKTLLALPVASVVLFTVIPLLILVLVAFTNYDQQHMPPTNLFTWVGFANFSALFGGSITSTFGYAFVRVLGWTLVWSFFATLTTYFGGILMSLLLNSKLTRGTKLWRTMLVMTIAVPQFVSLLLMRNLFSNTGLINTFCANIGLTGFLRDIGLISSSTIPFLSAPGWAHVMIIIINIWVGIPYQMLIATGVLMNLPTDQLESARIDGANPFQTFRHITMPYMLFVTGPALVTDFVKNFNNFNVIYLLTQDVYVTTDQFMAASQAREVDLLVTWLFNLTQNYYNYKMASVIGIMVFVVCAVFTLIAFNFMIGGNKEEGYQ